MSHVNSELKDFIDGIVPFLDKYIENFKTMQNILNANIFTKEEKSKIIFDLKDLENSLKEIINKLKITTIEISKENVFQQANRDFYSYFSDDLNPNKINFIIFVIYFYKLSDLYEFIYNHLENMKNIIVSKLSPNSYFYQQFVDFQMKTTWIKLQKLNLILKRLKTIIQYDPNKQKQKNYSENVKYSPHIEYKYSLIFHENLEDYIETFFKKNESSTKKEVQVEKEEVQENNYENTQAPLNNHVEVSSLDTPKKKVSAKLNVKIDQKDKSYIKKNILDTSGNYLWNSSMYYFLSLNTTQLEIEENYFVNVFYIDTHLGATPDLLRSQIIRTLVRKEKILSLEEAKNQYIKFSNNLFELNSQVILLNFKIPDELRLLFLYHLGPLVFYNINKQYLIDLNTGHIHQLISSKKNIIKKIIPYEHIKYYLFDWWIKNIMESLTEEQRNNYSEYQKLNTMVQKAILSFQRDFKNKYPKEEATYKNPNFIEFLKEKIGNVNVLLIQRYLNLFKHHKL